MSKSLEALERLKNTLLAEGYWQDVLQDIFTIEKDLKEKEELAQALSIVTCENGDLLKYKRAFNIIKDKRVNCFDVIDSVDYKHYLVLTEEYHKSWRLTKKEYDLVKEVLL